MKSGGRFQIRSICGWEEPILLLGCMQMHRSAAGQLIDCSNIEMGFVAG